ncbi:MAG TPA: hypothetical protein VLZ05_02835 [Mycobacterium sp.]|nr:hypothetical protein [Mycobacterium sp.]HUH67886.1 hypothetical protein [Mycobacterium sp.]
MRRYFSIAGCCALAVAAFPVSSNASSTAHVLAAGFAAIVLAIWPVLSISAGVAAPVVCRTRWAVSGSLVMLALLIWVGYEAEQGAALGLAERVAAIGELIWPLAVVVAARRSLGELSGDSPHKDA